MQQGRGRGQTGSRGGRPWTRGGGGRREESSSDSWRPRGAGRGRPDRQVPAQRNMEHMASVSRSSGLEADGDTLKDWKVQEEYRAYLQKKVDSMNVEKEDEQANVPILFRKLREGIYSSHRTDEFALEVYETSLFLSTLFNAPLQSTSIINHLFPSMYAKNSRRNHGIVTLLALLHHLIEGFPSQNTYQQLFSRISPRAEPHIRWIQSVAEVLRRGNYAKFVKITQEEIIQDLLPSPSLDDKLSSLSISSPTLINLPQRSLRHLISVLHAKVRQSTWSIIRAAYRELTLLPTTTTQAWLEKSLCLNGEMNARQWLEKQIEKGGTRKKEGDGTEGRWIVCKVR